MRILATGMEWFELIPGGLNQYFADYLRSMIRHGHTVEGLLSGEGTKLEAPAYIRDVLAERARTGTYRRIRSFRSSVQDRAALFAPDIFNPHFALYASLVTRGTLPKHVPIVTHFHGPWAQESQVEDQDHSISKFVRYRVKQEIEKAIYRRSDAFIALSHAFQNVLSSQFGIPKERIHVIPGAVDTERFHPAEDRGGLRAEMGLPPVGEGHVLLCTRRLVRRMGIENLIHAMGTVVHDVPDTRLYVAGDGPLKKELEELIASLGLEASVRLLGRVSNEELVRWYQAADLTVVPTVALEGFGLVTTESLACGTPVLGTPFGGTQEILGGLSGELLFSDKAEGAIAHKIVRVLQGECPIPTRRMCCEHVMRHYRWDNVVQAVTEVFERAIEARKERWHIESRLL